MNLCPAYAKRKRSLLIPKAFGETREGEQRGELPFVQGANMLRGPSGAASTTRAVWLGTAATGMEQHRKPPCQGSQLHEAAAAATLNHAKCADGIGVCSRRLSV